MNSYVSSIKREFWEYRTAFIRIPMIAAIAISVLMTIALILYSTNSLSFIIDGEEVFFGNSGEVPKSIELSIKADFNDDYRKEIRKARDEIEKAKRELEAVQPSEEVGMAMRELNEQLRLLDEQLAGQLEHSSNMPTPPTPPAPEPPKDVDTHIEIRHFPSTIEVIGEAEPEQFTEDNVKNVNNFVKVFFAFFCMMMVVIGIHYLLSCLYSDRKDNSILFWKSLPVSETQNVLVKFAIVLLAIPTIGSLAALVVSITYAILGMIYVSLFSASTSAWELLSGLNILSHSLLFWIQSLGAMLWSAPFLAWLMLCSAGAKRSPFLLAVLPFAAVSILETLFFGSHILFDTVLNRIPSIEINGSHVHFTSFDGEGLSQFGSFIFNFWLWFGLVLAGAQVYAAIWLRNHRYEI